MVTHGNTELLVPLRIQVVILDAGLDGGGGADADLEEGVRQVTAADVEKHIVSVRQTLGFNCFEFQRSVKKRRLKGCNENMILHGSLLVLRIRDIGSGQSNQTPSVPFFNPITVLTFATPFENSLRGSREKSDILP